MNQIFKKQLPCFRVLGLTTAIDTSAYVHPYVSDKIQWWASELPEMAKTQPHAALTHGLSSGPPSYEQSGISCNHIFRQRFLPALTRRPVPSDLERQLLALPAGVGGIGVTGVVHSLTTFYKATHLQL